MVDEYTMSCVSVFFWDLYPADNPHMVLVDAKKISSTDAKTEDKWIVPLAMVASFLVLPSKKQPNRVLP